MSVQTELEELISRRPETAEDAEQIAAAAALLADYHRLESRAHARSLAGLTLHEAAERVLADAGMPLHASELGRRMKAAGWRHPRTRNAPPQQIEHQLAARLPHYAAFQKVSP